MNIETLAARLLKSLDCVVIICCIGVATVPLAALSNDMDGASNNVTGAKPPALATKPASAVKPVTLPIAPPQNAQPSSSVSVTTPANAGDVAPANYGSLDAYQINTTAAHTLDLTANPDDVWKRIRRGYAVPNIDTPLVQQWTQYYATRPDYFRRTADRASKYLFFIIEELERRGMPSELALLPFVESAFNPTAYSSARASGLWQFIPSTGKQYKLEQNWWRDDRRDVIASTKAALDYLQYIYEMHGDWHLALASYNWGEGSVKRALDKNKARGLPSDYLSLDMPNETRNYVPKLQAIKNIVANPEFYKINLPAIANQQYFATVKKTRDIDLTTAAKLANMSLEDFKALNPSFNRPLIPGVQQATLLIPADRLEAFEAAIHDPNISLSNWTVHTIARGEGLESIAARYGTSVATLKSVNSLPTRTTGRGKRKRTFTVAALGTKLLVPRPATDSNDISSAQVQLASTADAGTDSAAAPAASRAVYTQRIHTVQRGETLYAVARRYNVTVAALKNSNRIQGNVKAGTRLTIPGGTVQTASHSTKRGHTGKATKPIKGRKSSAAKGSNKRGKTKRR